MSFMQLYFSFVLVGLRLSYPVLAQNVQFGQVSNLNGDMQLNTLIFPDNSKIETFSQTQRQVLVNQNPAPVPASHVMGSTGQPFVQLSQNSMTISTNGATDLVGAQIELPINQAMLQQSGVTADNTFVAMLSPNRQAWIIMEGMKSVNTTDNTVRMVKLNSIDGEYMAVGRQTTETSNVLTPFGSSQQQTVNITGSGIQEAEFQDGFRMSIMASEPMTINTNVVNGVSTSMLNGGAMSVNNYRYLVTTNLAGVVTSLNQMMAVVQLPLNANRLMAMAQSMGAGPNDTVSLGISQRSVIQNPGGATGGSLSPQKRQKKAASSSSKSSSSSTKSVKASKTSSSVVAEATPDTTDPETTSSSSPDAASTDASADAATTDAASADSGASGASNSSASSSPASNNSASSTTAATTPPPSAQQPGTNTSPQNPAATQLLLSPTFTPVTARTVLDMTNGRVAVTVNQLDGEFIITMAKAGAQNQVQARPGDLNSTGQTAQNEALGASGLMLPAKRQNTQGQSGLLVSMAQLKALVQQQKNGGMLPVMEMMNEMMAESQGALRQKRTGPFRMPHAV